MRTDDLFAFIQERYKIHERRKQGLPKPWTNDPILQSYRFCNVYREWDTQTQWFADNWREPNEDDLELWFASLVFRSVNWGETCAEIGYPVPWNQKKFENVLDSRMLRKEKVYSGAYMISTHGAKQLKYLYLGESLSKIWKNRKQIRYRNGEPLSGFHKRLMSCFDVGSFLAAQVVADCKYAGNMPHADDWWTFAASGPGSKRGLNRIIGYPPSIAWRSEILWREILSHLKEDIDPLIDAARMPRLHAQDLQNCLCEFDKYERVRLGEGRPKSKYNGVR